MVVEEGFRANVTIDLVCSNAGIAPARRLIRDKVEGNGGRLFAVNVFAELYFALAYAQRLKQSNTRGRLLLTGSENSLSMPRGVEAMGIGLYAATKAATLMLAEWMRAEFARHVPIDVHILLPGAVASGLDDGGEVNSVFANLRTLVEIILSTPRVFLSGCCKARCAGNSGTIPKKCNAAAAAQEQPNVKIISTRVLSFVPAAQCAATALKGLDLGLFYIPTHRHLADDMRPRLAAVEDAILALGL